jgi:hypothetical protein
MTNTYEFGSNEFQPLIVTKMINGVVTPVTTGIQYVIVPKGTALLEGLPQNAVALDGQVGFFTEGLARGYWHIGVRVNDYPEAPLVHAGFIRIR